jgi:hypothetical protein
MGTAFARGRDLQEDFLVVRHGWQVEIELGAGCWATFMASSSLIVPLDRMTTLISLNTNLVHFTP